MFFTALGCLFWAVNTADAWVTHGEGRPCWAVPVNRISRELCAEAARELRIGQVLHLERCELGELEEGMGSTSREVVAHFAGGEWQRFTLTWVDVAE